ncbi:hypothetical protein P8452_08107 [Trifolium repens]|nr:hypothetical protein P8452_08107 [Trifolium repens]
MCSLSLLPYICEPSKRRIAMNWSQFVQLPYNHHMSATSKFDLWSCVEKMKLSTKKKNVADSLVILSLVNRDPRSIR